MPSVDDKRNKVITVMDASDISVTKTMLKEPGVQFRFQQVRNSCDRVPGRNALSLPAVESIRLSAVDFKSISSRYSVTETNAFSFSSINDRHLRKRKITSLPPTTVGCKSMRFSAVEIKEVQFSSENKENCCISEKPANKSSKNTQESGQFVTLENTPHIKQTQVQRVLDSMEKMVKDNQCRWGAPFMVKGKIKFPLNAKLPLFKWLGTHQSQPFPAKMNCWETVLVAAHDAGLVDKKSIPKLVELSSINYKHGELDSAAMVPLMALNIMHAPSGKTEKYATALDEILDKIPAGHVIVFGQGGHVGLSAGKGMMYNMNGPVGTQTVSLTEIKETLISGSAFNPICWGPVSSCLGQFMLNQD